MAFASRYSPFRMPMCTAKELENILSAPSGGMIMLPSNDYDAVWPGIYIGDEDTARDLRKLRLLKITHVLNCAQGRAQCWCVDTNANYYAPVRIRYKGLEAMDILNFNIRQYFWEGANFIKECLDRKGRVLVHCRCGISRSSTVVLAYLMIHQRLTLQDAVRKVRAKREIYPNQGFQQQLCDFYQMLYDAGHYTHSHHAPTMLHNTSRYVRHGPIT